MITVVGSLNLDLFIESSRLPAPGETVLGTHFRREPGGKGANQACAVARLGAPVAMIGAVGTDAFGEELIRNLLANRVNVERIARREDYPTGTAFIVVEPKGQNQIVVAPGANATVTALQVEDWAETIQNSEALLVQLEIPIEAVATALRMAREAGVLAVLNPAPGAALPDAILRSCDWIVPNEIEAEQLTGMPVRDLSGAAKVAQVLRQKCSGANVALTLGANGVWLDANEFSGAIPAFPVSAVDAVGAGDAFIGALVTRLTEGADARAAARFGCAAAALSVTRRGAQNSLPSREEVQAFITQAGFEPEPRLKQPNG